MIKLGVLGVAHLHVDSYIECAKDNTGIELVGLADDEPERARRCAERHGTTAFDSINALLAARPHGVIICSENIHHRRLTEQAAEAGISVLCEKPLATTLEDAWAMISACRAAGVALMTAFPCRFLSPVGQVREIVASGRLGQILAIAGTNRGKMPGGWFVRRELSGGGAVIDHTVHVVDLMRWMTGAEVIEVYAETATHFHDIPVEDTGLLTMTFDNGVFATLDTSWSRPPKSFPTWGDVAMEIAGTEGVVELDALRQCLTVHSEAEGKTLLHAWGDNMDALMIAEFAGAVAGGREPSVTGEDGLRALEVALAAYESAETGKTVRLSR